MRCTSRELPQAITRQGPGAPRRLTSPGFRGPGFAGLGFRGLGLGFRTLGFASLAFTSLAVTASVHAAELTKPNIKPGLWEVSINPQVSGEMPIPPDQLAQMTPEQQARLQAALKANMAKGAKPRVYKECMTPEKIAKGLGIGPLGDDSSCKRQIVSSSASELTLHDECNKPDRKTVTDMHLEVKGGTQTSGKINVVMTSAGKAMTVNSTIQGKWLGASCGTVKDAELEK